METYHKINAPFKRDMTGEVTGVKGKLMVGEWARPEFEYLADNEWEFTEKVDGTNIRVHLKYNKDKHEATADFAGRTDNAVIPKPLNDALIEIFAVANFREWLVNNDLDSVTLFGEGYGPKIQGGGKYVESALAMNHHLRDKGLDTRVPEHKFVLFDVKIGDWWLNRDDVNDIAAKLGIESVPVLGTGTLNDAIEIVSSGITFNKGGGIVKWGRGGLQSQWGDFEAEGIVARPKVPLFNRKGERIITKIKAKDFK